MRIEDFWATIYRRMGVGESELHPRQISLFLDQAQRELVGVIDPERLSELGAIYDFSSLNDLAISTEDYIEADRRISMFKISGAGGMFWSGGTYDDKGQFSWPINQLLKPEVFRLMKVNIAPAYYTLSNQLSTQGKLYAAEEVTWEEIRHYDDAAVGSPLDSEDFYDRAVRTQDDLQGQYEGSDGVFYNIERTIKPKFATFGNSVIVYPPCDLNASTIMSVWALFFPERFIDMDGDLKTAFVNAKGQCQMPSQFWPLMIEWVVARLRGSDAQMKDVARTLNMGDAINVRDDEERRNPGRA